MKKTGLRETAFNVAARLDKYIQHIPGIGKAILVMALAFAAGILQCKGKQIAAYSVLGLGLVVSLGAFTMKPCRGKK